MKNAEIVIACFLFLQLAAKKTHGAVENSSKSWQDDSKGYHILLKPTTLDGNRNINRCHLGIKVNSIHFGRLSVTLNKSKTPIASNMFIDACKSSRGYKRSTFERIIPGVMIQSGARYDKASITRAIDRTEEFVLPHKKFSVSMANSDPGHSSFFISLENTPWLDGQYSVFGKLSNTRSRRTAKALSTFGSTTGNPRSRVTISNCLCEN